MKMPTISFERFAKSHSERRKERIPKGYVPLLVGSEAEEAAERILVHVSLLKDLCISELLEIAAQELGYEQQGILRIPCEAEHFRWIVNVISNSI